MRNTKEAIAHIEGLLHPRGLAEWLRLQDPDTVYDYCDGRKCLVAVYLKDHGVKDFLVLPDFVELNQAPWKIALPTSISRTSLKGFHPDDRDLPHRERTYGNALKYMEDNELV